MRQTSEVQRIGAQSLRAFRTSVLLFRLCAGVALLASLPVRGAELARLLAVPSVTTIKISPSGRYLAARVLVNHRYALHIVDRVKGIPLGSFQIADHDNEVGAFGWASDHYLVGIVHDAPRTANSVEVYDWIFGVNYDGSSPQMLEQGVGFARIIDTLPKDAEHILISHRPLFYFRHIHTEAYRLNMKGGSSKLFLRTKSPDGDFRTDPRGRVRVIRSLQPGETLAVKTLPWQSTQWVIQPHANFSDLFTPIAFDKATNSVLAIDNSASDTAGLYRMALDGSGSKLIYDDNSADIDGVEVSADHGRIYALRYEDGYPRYVFVKGLSQDAETFESLAATFPHCRITIQSQTTNGRLWTIKVASDVDPGSFYLFDARHHQLVKLITSLADVPIAELAQTRPVSFESFDGKLIHGFFTPGKGRVAGKGPMVVLLGTHRYGRVSWIYDSTVQGLASQGYSVLQVNFRGSYGYGKAFRASGSEHSGDSIPQDIIAGTKWAIAQQLAGKGHVCVMGRSYGGYLAVQSALLSPGLYACVISRSGIYDLNLLDVSLKYRWSNPTVAFMERLLPEAARAREQASPVHHVERLSAPILMVQHVDGDERAMAQGRAFRSILEKRHKRYQWFTFRQPNNAYGDTSAEIEVLRAELRFLHRYAG